MTCSGFAAAELKGEETPEVRYRLRSMQTRLECVEYNTSIKKQLISS